ncbi:MAG: proton-conducting transporter membrane subunit, partial [Candidatus Omnitrophica bacterium]|nr:proton-conducting transporter membrane subunit [Candidatus Omnitrophota bacterium]
AAFLCLAIGALAKAGAMPFHVWIPECSKPAPAPVMALLPASLDKLLGIYLLARISLNMFIITPRSWVSVMLLIIGSITIIAAVMMALVQHNLKKLLAYHAVSQVGYMVLGIGTGNLIGIAGGLFHMVNNAIYKSCLFLSAGSVEKEAKTAELDELGGLARLMPITLATSLVAALSISGIPPFNGFFSKWMIYQGLAEMGKAGDRSWIVWILVAMFGSALTLASFMKLLYAVFFSNRNKADGAYPKDLKEVSISMWLPQVTLALLCIIFGIWAYQIPIRFLIAPCLKNGAGLSYIGMWDSSLAAALLAVGLFSGLLLFIIGRSSSARRTGLFVGGEKFEGVPGIAASSFYDTIKNMPLLRRIYSLAGKKVFDIYEEGSKGVFYFTDILRWLHNGILPTYMTWCLIGMLVLFFMMR